ncbi:hypothetical protein FT663_02491 [Candidozyma haemuli var. vulneris]|uniref:RRM domain-containing protein n=1 Tax=Candidozyma haemuli TaxID=45357 RepID=A0A2V1AX56_9ASCO|nr:hypothetical protein CXQ85_005254 [[Candida] haemuloni]KAF3991932.1 hypothetical protein FT663_02491 [[Candida] haemuloni var. vulneris]KAF3991959.1 hypothetical protein FT662_01412 [[Candida] haemuloni var. vulneris]PVH22680.1 hypothetical protein CXQ85_005254 [[Candida] haemuloni]
MSEPVPLDAQSEALRDDEMQQDFEIDEGAQTTIQPPAGAPEQQQQQKQQSPEERLQQTEREADALNEINTQASASIRSNDPEKAAEQAEIDSRSVYIGNVDYGTNPVELQQFFADCGVVERITIQTNKITGQPKGFAYVEFETPEGAHKAVAVHDGHDFRGRTLKVNLKRTNVPGFFRGGGRGRGRGFRGRGFHRGRGRGFRGGGGFRGGRFNPY